MCKVEMLLPNYTKWSGMSCGGKKTMTSCGREKEEFWIHDKNGDFSLKIVMNLFLPFSTKI